MDEKRAILLTLEKAKKWYNSDNPELKELAATTYSLEELGVIEPWESIKTYEDACKKIGVKTDPSCIESGIFNGLTSDTNLQRHLSAIYKIDIILKALNGEDYMPCLKTGKNYYPRVHVFPSDRDVKKSLETWPSTEYLGYALINGVRFYFTGNSCSDFSGGLLDYFPKYTGFGAGSICADKIFHCKSENIAKHMSKYFAKEIFNAMYSQFGYFIQQDIVK
jgi:hypothetical protein